MECCCDAFADKDLAARICRHCHDLYERTEKLAEDLKHIPDGNLAAAQYYGDVIVTGMSLVRQTADKLERLTARNHWPYPIYSDLLFY